MNDISKVIMNPIRQRIMQYLLIHEKATTKSISEELSDIPSPTLYRHIKMLLDSDIIYVVEEEQIRGAIQKTYALNPQIMQNADAADTNALIQNALHSIGAAFQVYFAKENINPEKDMLSLTTSTLLLSDEECADFFKEINKIVSKLLKNQPTENRKPRRITFISSPCEEE